MSAALKKQVFDFKTQYGLALDDTDDAIIVDLFAGGGGASTGLEMGLGRTVDLAINHNPAAISMHEANHPHAEHLPTDVWGIDPIEATKGATVGWLHASPDCRHHSQAAGGQPRKKEIRDLSWVVIKWAGKLHKLGRGPWVISLENVKQILQWGPLIAKRDKSTGRVVRLDGTVAGPGDRVPRHEQFLVPDPKRKGRTWRQFLRALEGFGYHVDYWVERNCDYGDPTTRQRLYLVATDGGFEPVAAEKTHAAKPGKGLKPYRTAAECIDWSDLGQSIRNRKKPLAEATMRRIAKGIEKEVLQRAKPFIVPIANWSREAVHPVDQPLNTITAWPKGGAFSVATPTLIQVGYGERDGQAPRVLELDEPLGTVVAGGIKHAVAAAHLVKFRFDATGAPVDGPLGTQTGTDHHGLVAAHLLHLRGNCDARAADEPLHTVSAGGTHHGLVSAEMVASSLTPEQLDGALWVSAFLMRYHSTGGQWAKLDDPLTTITTKDRLALVTVWISGSPYVIVDIRLRMLKPRELYRAQGFPDSYIIERGHNGQRFTLSQQVHMCGNSVSPNTMAAYARANDPWKRRLRPSPQQVAA
ncbi:DNA cytosine methyltransferase [Pseudomonas aeruginosa]|uniref:DNA cytosine methyltransferase n=1 Tax=Pseudomonas aeruginosa TaxID=287 RepID=UPI000F826202|nr:DNA cytosine methyltransferase [Pseudomonas aeruginosa]MBI6989547.1 DNA cytosine methyltransferase [Pseudomonas aeruginosa]MBI6999171.1 DNA cytosine methyltransferase [Pseudomonas aeruginosa]RTW26999.1 DNA cytosine methyltransferase [Pseudomonas aeruginosa]